jgi:hypothetical protein
MLIQLIGRDNGAGLSRELHLMDQALRDADAKTHVAALPHQGAVSIWLTRMRSALGKERFDMNISLERIRPYYWKQARLNVLVPFPEWFRTEDRPHLSGLDEVWVKTRHAERFFKTLGAPTRFIGGTSLDRYLPDVPREHAFFHGPGRSGNKGTQALIELWSEHPEWPPLTLVWRRKRVELKNLPTNIRLIRDFIDDAEYQRLQNAHRFHLCPSQTEGFGHYLVEAMSCGAIVITLDAEPMNELVTPEHGILVPAHAVGTQELATLYGFEKDAMCMAIQRCIDMGQEELIQREKAARAWFKVNHEGYVPRLRGGLAALSAAAS